MATQGLSRNSRPGGDEPNTVSKEVEVLASTLLPSHARRPKTLEFVCPSIRIGSPAAVDFAVDRLMAKLLGPVLPELQRHLSSLEGLNLGKAENAQLARNLTRLLRRLGCRVACHTCGEPAVAIRYADMYKGGSWVWRYEHTPSRRHGGTVNIPPLRLVL